MDRTRCLLVLCGLLHLVSAQGDLEVLYSPDSLIFQNTSQTLSSAEYYKFVSLNLAYSTEKPSNWDGFYGYKNFANIPKSVVTINTPISLQSISAQSFILEENLDIDKQHSLISSLMSAKFENSFEEMIDLNENGDSSLKHQVDSFKLHLAKLKAKNIFSQPSSLWFNFKSTNTKKDLSSNDFVLEIQKIVKNIRQLTNDKVVILSIVNQETLPLKRTSRQASKEDIDYNLAYVYDADYHTAFATIGFTTIILLLAVFGVSVAMWNIDPGRDSIIYRLTAQKMKKEQ